MTPLDTLAIVAERLVHDRDDLRNTVLEVSDRFLDATAVTSALPEPIQREIAELRDEIEAVQPRFASHRRTSVLFDDAGLGRIGRERARSIADRIVAVVRLLTAKG